MQFNLKSPLSDPLIFHIFDFSGETALIRSSSVSKAFRDKVKEIWNRKVDRLCLQPAFLSTFGKTNRTVYGTNPLSFLKQRFVFSCTTQERRVASTQSVVELANLIETQVKTCVQASSLVRQTQEQVEKEWALNLTTFFKAVAAQCKIAETFLASLKDQSLNTKAENIFLWLQEKGNQEEIAKIEELNLNGKALTYLPYEISLFKGLRYLYLNKNNLTSLPDNIGSLVNLEFLYLGNNQLTTLPGSIGSLVNLKEIFLQMNKLRSLPTSIGSLVNLKWLYLAQNQLSSIPTSVELLVNLEKITLFDNPLKTVPNIVEGCQIFLNGQ